MKIREFKIMKVIGIYFAAALILLAISCNGTQPEKVLALNFPNAPQRQIPVRTGYATVEGMSYTDKDNKIQSAPSYTLYLANYDLDVKQNGRYLNAQPKTNEQTKVMINLIGTEGDGPTSLPRSGSYAPKADKFRKVRMMTISTRSSDKPEEFNFNGTETTGEVKINTTRSLGGENVIEGEIDVTQGNLVIKGPFSAKMLRSGK